MISGIQCGVIGKNVILVQRSCHCHKMPIIWPSTNILRRKFGEFPKEISTKLALAGGRKALFLSQ